MMAAACLFGMFAGTAFLFLRIIMKMREGAEAARKGKKVGVFEIKEERAKESAQELLIKIMRSFREVQDDKRWRRRCDRLLMEFTK